MTSGDPSIDGLDGGSGIVRTSIPATSDTSEFDLLELIADIDGCEITDLPPLYNEVEHVVETIFETPPSPESQMSISFSYAGYRITIDQTGVVELVSVKDSLDMLNPA